MTASGGAQQEVFVHLFQKVAVSKGGAFGRPPQRAELLIVQKLRRGPGNPSKGFPDSPENALHFDDAGRETIFLLERKRVSHFQKEIFFARI